MAEETAAISAPNYQRFLVSYVFLETALVVMVVVAMVLIPSIRAGTLFLTLSLVPLFATAKWVGNSQNARTLFMRSIAMHAASPVVPALLMALIGADSAGHGSGGMVIIVLLPPLVAVCAVIGVLSAIVSLLVMRRTRTHAG